MQLNQKQEDAENNNSMLGELKTEITTLARGCQQCHKTYTTKRNEVLMLRATGGGRSSGGGGGGGREENSWNNNSWSETTPQSSAWPENSSHQSIEAVDNPLHTRYRALYEFVGRNGDEVSFQPGDIILVSNARVMEMTLTLTESF